MDGIPPEYEIDVVRAHEIGELPRIEREASAIFPREDLQTAPDPHPPLSLYADAAADGRLWVARTRASAQVVGFALTMIVDGEAHLGEMDVLPAHGRRGLGRALVDRVVQWARERGHSRVTLTTFHHLPWNGPFYRGAGFVEIADADLGAELRGILQTEARKGLRNRIAMELDLSATLVCDGNGR
jgi:GNAT superfamily N-acetyltransferase